MSTADAVTREAAWLNTATADGLPILPAAAGGKWKVVQAYWPGARLATQQTAIYVQRSDLVDARFGDQRIQPQYGFTLKLVWPVRTSSAPVAETEAQAFDNAIDDLVQRVRGPLGDKTHGGRFLSVGEVPPGVWPTVRFDDPEVTIPRDKALRAVMTYRADDLDVTA